MSPCACWILCTPRTGSSFLCELLNNTKAFPAFDHPGLVKRRGPLEIDQSFNEWPRLFYGPADFASNPPPYCKMIFHQYVETFGNVSKSKRYNIGWYPFTHDARFMEEVSTRYNSDYVNKLFPDIKYIHLVRNAIDHAVSLYIARSTKKYHIYTQEDLSAYMNMDISVNQSRLLEAYKDALEYRNSWKWFLKGDEKIIEVEYEDLILDPSKVLKNIGSFLELDLDSNLSLTSTFGENKRIFRMTRPEADRIKEALNQTITLNKLI